MATGLFSFGGLTYSHYRSELSGRHGSFDMTDPVLKFLSNDKLFELILYLMEQKDDAFRRDTSKDPHVILDLLTKELFSRATDSTIEILKFGTNANTHSLADLAR
jgi:hypothetical protein